MTRGDAERRAEKLESHPEGSRRNRREEGLGASRVTARGEDSGPETEQLMEAVVERENMKLALARVEQNRGAGGVDKMTVEQLRAYLGEHWQRIKEELLADDYHPQPVLKVEIPKPDGKGMRTLGIPTVVDRLIQQALHQVLSPIFEPDFSESSYGFRPNRSAQQAVLKARGYVREGRRWVVDIDLEKFFDRVNHDIMMSRLARRIKDKRVLRLIRRYLQAGMMSNGLATERREGTPQGGPLSPLLSNILLTDLDGELERRGHTFCRYADDCNIYVASARAGVGLLQSLTGFLSERLKLKVNASKSAVARPWQRKFLGYSMTWHQQPKLRIAAASVTRLTEKVKARLRGARGRNVAATIQTLNPLLRGWAAYFKLAATRRVLEECDGWLRHKLRCVLWRQWKRPYARVRNLMKRGLTEERAWRSASNQRGPWWNSGASHMHAAFPKSWFDSLGLVSLLDTVQRFQRVS